MKKMPSGFIVLIYCLIHLSSCGVYSFSGAAIPKDIKTTSIIPIVSKATSAPNALERIFTEQLRNKMSVESGLSLVNRKGDYEFSGIITNYSVVPISPTDGSFATKNRITLTVEINFINNKKPEETWTSNFTRYVEFNTQNLSTVEEGLLTELSKQIAQDVFNKALANW